MTGRRPSAGAVRKLCAGAALLLLLAPASARADLAADCNDATDADRKIHACTILIEDRRLSADNAALAYINRANAYGHRKDYPRALEDYAAAIALHPAEALAYYNRANVHFDLGNRTEAIADYTKVIGLSPNFALAYFNRGLAREVDGDRAGAVGDYMQVLHLEPSAAKAKARLRVLQTGSK